MSTREIVGHLRDLYGIEVSPALISAVTDAVLEEVAAWQARPLEATYPLVFFDALRVKIRDEGPVRNKAVRTAFGVRADGAEEIHRQPPASSSVRTSLSAARMSPSGLRRANSAARARRLVPYLRSKAPTPRLCCST